MYEAELNLELNLSKCDCQDRVLSTISPKKVVLLVFCI